MHAITGQKGIELYAPNGYCGAYNEIGTIGLQYTKTGRETQWATKTTQSMVGKVTNKDDRCGAVFTSNKSQIIIDPAGLVVVKQCNHNSLNISLSSSIIMLRPHCTGQSVKARRDWPLIIREAENEKCTCWSLFVSIQPVLPYQGRKGRTVAIFIFTFYCIYF